MYRRANRSSVRREAVSLYLSAVMFRNGIRAAVLSSEEGGLIGGAGQSIDLDHLAALGAHGASGQPHRVLQIEQLTRGEPMRSYLLNLDGQRMVLTTIGDAAPPVEQTAHDLRRILAHAHDTGAQIPGENLHTFSWADQVPEMTQFELF
jgi:hypothetical protein